MAIKNGPSDVVVADKDEPGAVDNRLSLVPSDFPVTEDWEDGQEYDLSELGDDVKLRQISPGEFEVIPGASARQAASDEEAAGEPPAKPSRGTAKTGYRNPAVASMADEMA